MVQSDVLYPDDWLSKDGGMLEVLYGAHVHVMFEINMRSWGCRDNRTTKQRAHRNTTTAYAVPCR